MNKLIEFTGGLFYFEIMIMLFLLGTGICGIIVLNRSWKKHDKVKPSDVLFTITCFAIPAIWIGYTFGRISILSKLF